MGLERVYLVIGADPLNRLVEPRSSEPSYYEGDVLVTNVGRLDLALDESVVRILTVQLQPVAESCIRNK